VARFTRTLGTLVSSGVAILDGLEITARTAGNRVIQDAVMNSRASIAGGDTISGPLKESGAFPPMVVQMINVGEQTGGLDEMLSKIADFYDDEVDAAVSALLSVMEPIMIVVLGVVVGGMIVAMYLPIFDMVGNPAVGSPWGKLPGQSVSPTSGGPEGMRSQRRIRVASWTSAGGHRGEQGRPTVARAASPCAGHAPGSPRSASTAPVHR
jgi:hypothetical protein